VAAKTHNLGSTADCLATTGILRLVKFRPVKELTDPDGGMPSPFDGPGWQRECFKNNGLREI
jgi:hypothetical protein